MSEKRLQKFLVGAIVKRLVTIVLRAAAVSGQRKG